MNLEEIKESVKWCLDMEDAQDPCYHCRQKVWLIQELEKARNPLMVISSPSPEEINAQFRKELESIGNHTAIYLPIDVTPQMLEISVDTGDTFVKTNDLPTPAPADIHYDMVTRKTPTSVYTRQELIFLKDWRQPGQPGCGSVPKAVRVPLPPGKKPDRIWTLYRHCDENVKPELPFAPVHRFNAFIEDYVHDWNERKMPDGSLELAYSSRVADGPVWILLEYKE